MKYRADIDGLRAISVLIVLLFHAHIPKIKSGFIGVDIFFVISGFLITGIIIDSLNNKKFTLLDFYKRRFLRLAPALILLVLVAYIISIYFYLPKDFIYFATSVRWAVGYSANLFFAATTGGYFDAQSDYMLLLHTWSLAVEWQWYALLPIALVICHRFLGARRVPIMILLLLCIFTYWTMYQSSRAVSASYHYYALSSRAFELLMGASLVFIPYERIKISSKVLSVMGSIALLAILICLFESKVKIMFPNYYALLVSVSASALLFIGQVNKDNWVTRFLSWKPLVFIGLISYSLYLWHWPIFALIRYLDIKETLLVTLLSLSLSIILGYLSWRFIEQKTRYLRSKPFMLVLLILFILPLLSAFIAEKIVVKNHGFPQRFQNSNWIKYELLLQQYYSQGREQCIDNKSDIGKELCVSGSKNFDAKRAIVLGDSYMNQHWNFIDVLAKDANIKVESNTQTTCLMLQDIYLFDLVYLPNQPYMACRDITDELYKKITTKSYDYVLLGQVWSNYLADKVIEKIGDERSSALSYERVLHALDRSIATILSTGAQVIIFDETYIDERNADNKCFLKSIKTRQADNDECSFDIEWKKNEHLMKGMFTKLREKYPEVVIVDPKKMQCPNEHCLPTIDGIPIYSYGSHINDYASRIFGMNYLNQYGNPFLKGSKGIKEDEL